MRINCVRRIMPYTLLAIFVVVGICPTAWAKTYLYVANGGGQSVSVINARNDKTVTTIRGISRPFIVAANPMGSRVLVTSESAKGKVTVIDTATNAIIKVLLFRNVATGVAFSPKGAFAYIARCAGKRGGCKKNAVSVINMRTYSVVRTMPVPSRGWAGIAISPDGRYLYVTSENGLFVMKATSGKVVKRFPIDGGVMSVREGMHGHRLYIAGLSVGPSPSKRKEVMIVKTTNNTRLATYRLPNIPIGLVASPAGRRLYLAYCPSPAEWCKGGFLDVFSVATHRTVDSIKLGPGTFPYGVAISKDGKRIYVANDDSPGTVAVIDSRHDAVRNTIPVGTEPTGIAIVSVHDARVPSKHDEHP